MQLFLHVEHADDTQEMQDRCQQAARRLEDGRGLYNAYANGRTKDGISKHS